MSDSESEQYTNWNTIADRWGHHWAAQVLQRAVATRTVSHAYLITGPYGVGKFTLARTLAAALLCTEDTPPCGVCRACRLVASQNHPDLHIVSSERVGAALKIDQVRELQRQLALTPGEGKYRVAILQRFEEATQSASNALLKTLEEPPPYVVIVVLTTDADFLLPTIVSRCQQIPLRPLPIRRAEESLRKHWQVSPEQAELLAHLSGGRLEWAVQALGPGSENGNENKVPSMYRNRDRRLEDLVELLSASHVERFQYAFELSRDPVAVQETLDLWIGWWRDVMLLASQANVPVTNVDRLSQLERHAQWFGIEQSAAMLQALRQASERLGQNANPRLVLEVLMLDWPQM